MEVTFNLRQLQYCTGTFYKNLARVRISRSKVKVKVIGNKKNEKLPHFVRESSSGGAVLVWHFFGSGPRERGYTGDKISACCLVCRKSPIYPPAWRSEARWTFLAASVSPHDNFRMTKRRTIKLGGYVHCTKILPELEGQGHQGQKK